MYTHSIHSKIELLGYVMDDITALRRDMASTTDPALLLEYKVELESLIEELNEVGERVIYLIGIYIEECKETNTPVLLDYYRVYKELIKSKEVL